MLPVQLVSIMHIHKAINNQKEVLAHLDNQNLVRTRNILVQAKHGTFLIMDKKGLRQYAKRQILARVIVIHRGK